MSHYLSPAHVAELAASGISVEVAIANAIHTEVDAAENGRLLNYKGPAKKLGDCLVYPFHDPDGNRLPYVQLKPANPPVGKGRDKGKVQKYLCPMYAKSRAYFPVNTRRDLSDPAVPILITEGPKKAASADANGFACIGLVGIWAFAKPLKVGEDGETVGEKEPIPDLAAVAWDGRDVFIVFDSDRAEKKEIRTAEKQLAGVLAKCGAKVKVVIIPAADDGSKQGVDDFIVAHGPDKLACLIGDAKPVEEDTDLRPLVYTTVEIHEMARRVREVLASVPGVFARGNVLMQEMLGKLSPVPSDAMPELLSQHIRFVKVKKTQDGEEVVRVSPPTDAARPVFARPGEPIREVKAVGDHPIMLLDGRILDRSGFDHASGTLVRLPDGFHMAPVPEHPTCEDAMAAAARLLDVFCDFPFVDDGDDDPRPGKVRGCHSAAAVIAFMLSVVARQAIAGPVPMTIVTKNCPGTGGTLLIETCALIVTGRHFDLANYPHDHREMRLLITCWAMEGRTVAFLDNLVGIIGDAELCRAITSTTWTDRILGGSKTYSGPLTTVFVGTSNNAELGADMPRRVIPVRMETDMPNPERRKKFKHDLNTYPLERRPQLLADLFIMLRAWQLAGRPQQDLPPLGKFEAWTRVVRQVCVFSGLADPYLRTQAGDDARSRLVRTIAFGIREMDTDGHGLTAAAITKRLTTPEIGIPEVVQEAADAAAELMDRVTPVALGKILGRAKGRNLDGIKIVEAPARDHRKNLPKWTTTLAPTADEGHDPSIAPPSVTPDPPFPSPESPANGSTREQFYAGDSGDSKQGVGDLPANGKQRCGRVQSNQHRGTPLDKGGSA